MFRFENWEWLLCEFGFQQYALKEKEENLEVPKPSEVKEVESSENPAPAVLVLKKDEPPVKADADQGGDSAPADENNVDASAAAAVENSEANPAAENDSGTADQESSGPGEEEDSGDQESTDEPQEIKVADSDDLSTNAFAHY